MSLAKSDDFLSDKKEKAKSNESPQHPQPMSTKLQGPVPSMNHLKKTFGHRHHPEKNNYRLGCARENRKEDNS